MDDRESPHHPQALRALIEKCRAKAQAERDDNWCNTDDAPIWRAIHAHRADVYDKVADELASLLPQRGESREEFERDRMGETGELNAERRSASLLPADPMPCSRCGGVESSDGDWFRLCRECYEASLLPAPQQEPVRDAEWLRRKNRARKHVRQMQAAAWDNGCPDLAQRIEAAESELIAVLMAPPAPQQEGK